MFCSWEAQREKQELSHQNYVKMNAFTSPCPDKRPSLGSQTHVLTGCAIAALADTSGKAQTHLGIWVAGTKANRRSRAQLNLAAGAFTANASKKQSDMPVAYDIKSNVIGLYNPSFTKTCREVSLVRTLSIKFLWKIHNIKAGQSPALSFAITGDCPHPSANW